MSGQRVRLVGVTEIAALLGLSRPRVKQLTKTPQFPEPYARLMMGDIWALADVEAMAVEQGRPLDHAALAALVASRPRTAES